MCDPFGLFVYAMLLAWIYMLAILRVKINDGGLLVFILFLPAVAVAAFRGGAGVDTPLYVIRYEYIESFFDIPAIEPLIPLLMWSSKGMGLSFPGFSIIYGALVSLFYIFAAKNKNFIYFGVSIFPVIFIDSLFNGIRVGLAYPLILIAISNRARIVWLFSMASHISSASILFSYLPKIISIAFIVLIIGLMFKFDSTLPFLPERYLSKFEAYGDKTPSTAYAGIADTVGLFIAFFVWVRSKKLTNIQLALSTATALVVLLIIYIYFIRESAAALRFVRLLMVYYFGLALRDKSQTTDKISLVLCVIFGFAYSANFLRQIAATCTYAEGGFLPLTF